MKIKTSPSQLVRAAIAYAKASKRSGESLARNQITINRINDLLDEARRFFDRAKNEARRRE